MNSDIKLLVELNDHIQDLNDCLSKIYLNHISDNSLHSVALKDEIESLAEKHGGKLKKTIDVYKENGK